MFIIVDHDNSDFNQQYIGPFTTEDEANQWIINHNIPGCTNYRVEALTSPEQG